MVGLEKIATRRERSETLRLVIGLPRISTKFLEPKVEIWTALEEGGSRHLPLMGRI